MITDCSLTYLFKNRLPFDEQKIGAIRTEINNFLYPIGILPVYVIENNILYHQTPFSQNVNYFSEYTQFLFNGVYSEQEINIINLYLSIIGSSTIYNFSEDITSLMRPFIDVHSDKPEIEYCLDEIRHKYVSHLIYSDDEDAQEIESLLSYLSEVQETHNAFQIGQPK